MPTAASNKNVFRKEERVKGEDWGWEKGRRTSEEKGGGGSGENPRRKRKNETRGGVAEKKKSQELYFANGSARCLSFGLNVNITDTSTCALQRKGRRPNWNSKPPFTLVPAEALTE